MTIWHDFIWKWNVIALRKKQKKNVKSWKLIKREKKKVWGLGNAYKKIGQITLLITKVYLVSQVSKVSL